MEGIDQFCNVEGEEETMENDNYNLHLQELKVELDSVIQCI